EGDDFAIQFDGNHERGMFSSTRTGGKGNSDLYTFNLPPLLFALEGKIVDKETKKGIFTASVHLVGSYGSDVSIKTDTGGNYDFGPNGNDRYIKQNTSYIVSAGAQDLQYLNSDEKANETTVGLTESKTFVHNFELQLADIRHEIHFPRVLYDLDKDTHTDQQGQKAYNLNLSQARAQSCVDFLKEKGIDSARLTAKGWGDTKLLIDNKAIAKMKTKEEKQAAYATNRRTVFRVLSFDYVPKGHVMTAQDSMKMKAMMKKTTVSGEENDNDTTDTGVPLPPAPPQNNNTPGSNNTPNGGTDQKPAPKKQ